MRRTFELFTWMAVVGFSALGACVGEPYDPTAAGGNPGGVVSTAEVACGGDTMCDPAQVCCVNTQLEPPMSAVCSAATGCSAPSVAVVCDGPEDCPEDDECCGTVGEGGHIVSLGCDPTCDGAGLERLCHNPKDCGSLNARCEMDGNLLDGPYGFCKL